MKFRSRRPLSLEEAQTEVIRATHRAELVGADVERKLRISKKVQHYLAKPGIILSAISGTALETQAAVSFSEGAAKDGLEYAALGALFIAESVFIYRQQRSGAFDMPEPSLHIPDNWVDKTE